MHKKFNLMLFVNDIQNKFLREFHNNSLWRWIVEVQDFHLNNFKFFGLLKITPSNGFYEFYFSFNYEDLKNRKKFINEIINKIKQENLYEEPADIRRN